MSPGPLLLSIARLRVAAQVTSAPYLPSASATGATLLFCAAPHKSEEHLPQSHTCFNKVDVPLYRSAAQLKAKLKQAIDTAKSQGGFQFA
eukprot:1744052-Prymnesium_polylepis.2